MTEAIMTEEIKAEEIPSSAEPTPTPAPQLDLALPRVITLNERGVDFTLTFRRILPEDWKVYFAAISIRNSRSGDGVMQEMDRDTPYILLVNQTLIDAAGYKVKGDTPLKSLPNWQQRIPVHHRLQAGRLLASARASAGDGEITIRAEGDEVFLNAAWSTVEQEVTPGITVPRVQVFNGLRHVLAMPTEKQCKRFNSEASRSTVIGGSRQGTTVYRAVAPVLAELYDELVLEVDESYVVNGAPLTTREQIVREMDYHHKIAAAEEVFQPSRTVAVNTVVANPSA